MYAGPIVDAHFHTFQRADIPQYGLLSAAVVQRDFSVADYRLAMKGAQLVGGIVLQAADIGTGLDELAYIERLPPDPLVSRYISYLPIDHPDAVGIVDELSGHDIVAGIRFSPSQSADQRVIDRPAALRTLRELGRRGMVYELSARPWQHDVVFALASAVPETTFVLGHLGKPRISRNPQADWFEGMERLATLPNIVCKVSVPLEGPEDLTYQSETMRPLIRHAVGCFGYERVMFGSNFPVNFISVTCEGWLNMLEEFLFDATDVEREKLYLANATRIYGLSKRL